MIVDCEVDFLITQQKSGPRPLSGNQSSFLVLSYTPSYDVQLAFAMCFFFQEAIFNIFVPSSRSPNHSGDTD